ncbi:MAG: sigma-70 family RNA polymerase sigma factor [Phycisphaerae bacterium]
MKPSPGDVTALLGSASGGDQNALAELLSVVYEELRKLAAGKMRVEPANHTLQPTALVHEAFLRLVGQEKVNWRDRTHFFGVAAEVMRRVLVDHARKRKSAKRGGGRPRIQLDEALVLFETHSADLLELDEALKQLAELDPQQARIVELRFFGGLSIKQTSDLLGISQSAVDRGWRISRAWLMKELGGD